jgi:UDP-3-O-acyl N-acetylglucosamine deacetylase
MAGTPDPATVSLTLAKEVIVTGVGLHTGATVTTTLRPRGEEGIVFVREDLSGSPSVKACTANVDLQLRRTVLRDGAGEVQTAEHLLAVLYALGIDSAEIRLSGPELPGLDGSSRIWLEEIGGAGTAAGPPVRRLLDLREALSETAGAAAIVAVPNQEGLLVDYTLDHDSAIIPVQRVSYRIDADTFAQEIAPARTFVLEEEAQALLAAGLGRGATTENTLVVGKDGVRDNTLRFPDEFARHKVLDLLGDLSLIGAPLNARIVGIRSGHELNAALAKQIIARHAGRGSSTEGAS